MPLSAKLFCCGVAVIPITSLLLSVAVRYWWQVVATVLQSLFE